MNACQVCVGLLERESREARYSSRGLVVISRNILKGLSLCNFTKFSNWCRIDTGVTDLICSDPQKVTAHTGKLT